MYLELIPFFFHFSFFQVIFAPNELKVRASVNTLNVTWQPSPNHTLVSGYKLSCREVEAEETANGERTTQTHTIRLRKKARYHLLTGLGTFLELFDSKQMTAGFFIYPCPWQKSKMKSKKQKTNSTFLWKISFTLEHLATGTTTNAHCC